MVILSLIRVTLCTAFAAFASLFDSVFLVETEHGSSLAA